MENPPASIGAEEEVKLENPSDEALESKIFSLRNTQRSLAKKLGEEDLDVIELGKTIEGLTLQWNNVRGKNN